MAGRISGAGGRLPIRHGVGGFAMKFIYSSIRRDDVSSAPLRRAPWLHITWVLAE